MRMWGSLAVIIALGIPVLGQMGLPSAERAAWYGWSVALVGLAMCWGGAEAARWLLRESPLVKVANPSSDWAKLWVYSGVPGGVLMLFWLGLGWLLHGWVSASVSTVLLGQALLGPAVWLVVAPWIVKDLASVSGGVEAVAGKVAVALAVHALGMLVAYGVYPHLAGASLTTLIALASSLSALYPLVFSHLLLIGVLRRLAWRKKQVKA